MDRLLDDPALVPETKYARNGDVYIAYQVFGEGDVTFVGLPGAVANIGVIWEEPSARRFLAKMGSFCRFVHFDKRGQGLSDRTAGVPTMDERLGDLAAVLDATGTERAVLAGISEGGSTAAMFAATYPERVLKLTTFGSFARVNAATGDAFFSRWAAGWGTPETITVPVISPAHVGDETFLRWVNKFEMQSTTPRGLLDTWQWIREIDLRPVLGSIQCPTLVMHRRGDRLMPVQASHELAQHIPGAQLLELDGDDHMPWFGDTAPVLDALEEFVTDGHRHQAEAERVLATVLVTDIVDSTSRAAAAGDAAWRRLLDQHDTLTTQTVAGHRGRVVKFTGDGVLATFDAPGRALHCAHALRRVLEGAGLPMRAGVHTGEIEVRGDDIGGLGVHIAARIGALADGGEVLASRTVRDLTAGSGFAFESCGQHSLKGVPDRWELFRTTA